jgi:NAD(P)-dependent dehydrogenase (short-subunit alcohol dehydrogenase family)
VTTTYPFKVLDDEFKGKRVLVTGGTKGMGAAMVSRFRMSGALVATTARSAAPEGSDASLFIPSVGPEGRRRSRSSFHSSHPSARPS